jgi:ABC-type branched-subunit amino acid transport system ATPase component
MSRLLCEGLTKRFGGLVALTGVDLTFPRRGVVAIIGPNGAGKTTLMNVVTGFARPDSGRCVLDGREITGLAPHRIARLGLARTFQEVRLVTRVSLLENLLLACPHQAGEGLVSALAGIWLARERLDREKSLAILRTVGLGARSAGPAGELSYGQKKLLSIACCLATEASILFLDEPFAGVDPVLASEVLKLLHGIRESGKCVVFIEHDLGLVRRIADRLIVMDRGRVIAEGPPGEVLDRPEIIEAYIA